MTRARSARPRASAVSAASPWEQRDRLFFGLSCGLGFVALVIAWYGSSTSTSAQDGWAWFNVGLAGLTLAGIAYVLWFLRGRRAVGIARALLLPGVLAPAAPTEVSAAAPDGGHLVAGAGMSRFHRPDCVFASGRSVTAAPRAQHVDTGLLACEICEP